MAKKSIAGFDRRGSTPLFPEPIRLRQTRIIKMNDDCGFRMGGCGWETQRVLHAAPALSITQTCRCLWPSSVGKVIVEGMVRRRALCHPRGRVMNE